MQSTHLAKFCRETYIAKNNNKEVEPACHSAPDLMTDRGNTIGQYSCVCTDNNQYQNVSGKLSRNCVIPPHLDVVGLHASGDDVTDGAEENEIATGCLRVDLVVQRRHPDGPPKQHRTQISDLTQIGVRKMRE